MNCLTLIDIKGNNFAACKIYSVTVLSVVIIQENKDFNIGNHILYDVCISFI